MHYPKLQVIIAIGAITIGCLSVMSDWYVAHDTVENSSLKSLIYILPTMTLVSNTIFESFMTNDLIHDIAQFSLKFRRNSLGNILNKIDTLKYWSSLTNRANHASLYNFWCNMKNEQVKNWLFSTDLYTEIDDEI